MKKVLVLALIMSLTPIVKQHNINGRIITVCHNDVVDIMPLTSTNMTLYDYGNSKTIVIDNLIFTNIDGYSVE